MITWFARACALTLVVAGIALAQDEGAAATVAVAESETFGPHLVDGDGYVLYLFVDESMEASDEGMIEGVRDEAAACTEGCLEAWPPLEGEVQAGEGVDPELLTTAEVAGVMQAVYNGWPLYYFAQDEEPGQANGQARGGEDRKWYLVSPDGSPIRESMSMDDDEMMDDEESEESMD